MRQRCPICLFNRYEVYPREHDPPQPATSSCGVCGLSWEEYPGYYESTAVKDCAEAILEDWRGYLLEWLKDMWLKPWIVLRCWIWKRTNGGEDAKRSS